MRKLRVDEQRIGDIVGADNTSTTPETCMIYSSDVTSLPDLAFQIVSPRFDVVTQPVDVSSLQNLVLYAQEKKIPIVPRGNGTSGWGGAIPARAGICIALSKMSRVLYFNELEAAITVEAGITWRDLLSFLERLGFTLTVYPSSATAATVGGFVASGGIGIGSTRHGDILKQVLGIEAILPNGGLVRLGRLLLDSKSDTLQNDAEEGTRWLQERFADVGQGTEALDMRMIAGTYGTLGIITKVTLKTIPNLQCVPFACSFDTMTDLIGAARRIMSKTRPYFLRFLADNYTSKLRAVYDYANENGRFVLTGALLDTIYQNEESLESIQSVTERESGTLLDHDRAWFYWSERLFPLRIKRHGPSLVPAELLAPIDKLPDILKETEAELIDSKVAIEGTFSNDGRASFMVWILDDERKKVSFTVGWYRSFQIASLAQRFGSLPYAVGLWNARHAREYYGDEVYERLRALKKRIDPENLMNPIKVFGGRATIARESMLLGFSAGFAGTLIIGLFIPAIFSLEWLEQILAMSILPMIGVPLLFLFGIMGGLAGMSVMKLMTVNQALSFGVPILKILSRLFRR
jgi:FAD/FMN-containing dehydrogenase